MSLTSAPNSGFRSARQIAVPLALLSALVVPLATTAQAQAAGNPDRATLKVTTSVAAAEHEFRQGLMEWDNINFVAARGHFAKAVELDPALGIARVLRAGTALGMPAAERETELKRGLADAAKGSSNELLAATAFGAMFLGTGAEAFNLFRAAAVAMPGEPTLAYRRALNSGALPNRDLVDVVVAQRAVRNAFPEFAPVRNTLAYNLWNLGNQQLALAEVREYVRLLPNHPNSHDSYAELLQWDGRLAEAIPHYRRAVALDPGYTAGYDGIAEAQVLMGRGDLARASLAEAEAAAPLPGDAGRHRRIAATYLVEGNARAATTELGRALAAVKAAGGNTANAEATLHFQMAMVDFYLGDGKATASHAGAAAAGGPLAQANARALEALGSKDYAAAHQQLQGAIREGTAAGTPGGANAAANLEVTEALVYAAEGRGDDAMAALGRGNSASPLGRMAAALAARAQGDLGTARSVSYEILANRQFTLLAFNAALAKGVARGLVSR